MRHEEETKRITTNIVGKFQGKSNLTEIDITTITEIVMEVIELMDLDDKHNKWLDT